MATVGGGGGDNPPPLRREVSEVHEVSGSWMNLTASQEERGVCINNPYDVSWYS